MVGLGFGKQGGSKTKGGCETKGDVHAPRTLKSYLGKSTHLRSNYLNKCTVHLIYVLCCVYV